MKTQKRAIEASRNGFPYHFTIFLFKAKLKPFKRLVGQILNWSGESILHFPLARRVYA